MGTGNTRVRDRCVCWGSAEGLRGMGQGRLGVSESGQGPKDKGQRDQEYPRMWDGCQDGHWVRAGCLGVP